MYKKIGIFVGVGLGAALIGGGIATGIILPKALKAKEGLEKFVSIGGKYNSLSNKDKINIVTIGDSESAGFLDSLKRDEKSYADFLAKSFQNAGRLGKYHNFAKSGERLADIKKDVFEDAYIMRQIAGQKDKDGNKIKGTGADLITVTIGANDIIAYLRFLNVPYSDAFGFLKSDVPGATPNYPGELKDTVSNGVTTQKVDFHNEDAAANKQWSNIMTQSSESRWIVSQQADTERTAIFGDNPGLNMDKTDSYNEFENSIDDLKDMFVGKNQKLLNLDKDWFPKIYDLVKREMTVLVRDLHEANPDAQIVVLGHAYPFGQLNKSVSNNKKPELDNTTLKENFSRLLDSMKDGAEQNIDGDGNKFVSFYKIDQFDKFRDSYKNVDFSSFAKFKVSVTGNTMPNIAGIHPSVLGYDKIGESLYDIYGKEAGIKNIKATTQHSYPAGTKDDPATTNIHENMWTRIDESYDKSNTANYKLWMERYIQSQTLSQISNIGGLFKGPIADIVLPVLNQLLSKDNNVKLTDAQMMASLKTIIANNDKLSKNQVIGAAINQFAPQKLTPLTEVGNIIGAVRTQLKEGLKDKSVTEIEMFKLAKWGLHSIFEKILKAQADLKPLLNNSVIANLLNS